MKKTSKHWILTLIIGSALLVLACSSNEAPSQAETAPQSDQPAVAVQAPAGAVEANQSGQGTIGPVVSKPLSITGTVVETDAGLVVATDTLDYHVSGQDLSDMIGKQVTVTGALMEDQDKITINVTEVTPMEPQK